MPEQNKNEKRIYSIELENVETREGEKKTLKGVAIKYNSLSEVMYGAFVERIMPGALDKTLSSEEQVCLWGHDTMYVLGRKSQGTLTLRNSADGLHFEVIPPETSWANDLLISVSRGDIRQMSFGFNVVMDKWLTDKETMKKHGFPVREIHEMKLHEISLVSMPAYSQTSVRGNPEIEYVPVVPKDDYARECDFRERELEIRKRKSGVSDTALNNK